MSGGPEEIKISTRSPTLEEQGLVRICGIRLIVSSDKGPLEEEGLRKIELCNGLVAVANPVLIQRSDRCLYFDEW